MRTMIWCAVVAFALVGCGRSEFPPPRDSTSASATATTTRVTTTVPPTTTVSPTPPSVGPTSRGEMTLRGVVQSGVEGGCLLLEGYLLLGGDPQVVAAGAEVEVQGRPSPGAVTTCQQGTPFEVSSAVRTS